ncbi:MAG: hypothetical protein JW895_07565 [Thermoleophilaceae bacterium]|nr:hypothetical protein [Thermoleophilaceae bacterium]
MLGGRHARDRCRDLRAPVRLRALRWGPRAPARTAPTCLYDQAITGGTGRFAGARGTVTVDQQPTGDRFTFKIRVDRPKHRKRR